MLLSIVLVAGLIAPASAASQYRGDAEVEYIDDCESVTVKITSNGHSRGWRVLSDGEVLRPAGASPSDIPQSSPPWGMWLEDQDWEETFDGASLGDLEVQWYRTSQSAWVGEGHPKLVDTKYSSQECVPPEPECTPVEASIANYRTALGLSGPFDDKGNLTDGKQTVTLGQQYCEVTLHLTSYELPTGNIEPFEDQVKFDNHSVTIKPGETKDLSVALPQCAYQIDLYVAPNVVDPPPHHGEDRPGVFLLDWDVDTSGGPCTPQTDSTKLKVEKKVGGLAAPHGNPKYEFEVECGDAVVDPAEFSLRKNGSTVVEVEYDAGQPPVCTITETKTNGATSVSNTHQQGDDGTVAEIQLQKNWTKNTVKFTNRFDKKAEFKVHKVVDGDRTPPEGSFDFEWQCGDQTGSFSLNDGEHSGWIPVYYSNVYAPINCTITEVDDLGADAVSNTRQPGEEGTVAQYWLNKHNRNHNKVTFTNTFEKPTFDISFDVKKKVTGNGPAPDGDFSFSWWCGPGLSGDFELGHNQTETVTFTSKHPGPFLCTVTETDKLGADHVSNTGGFGTIGAVVASVQKHPTIKFINRFDLPPEVSSSNECDALDIRIDANDSKLLWRIVDKDGKVAFGPKVINKGGSEDVRLDDAPWDNGPYQVQTGKKVLWYYTWTDFGDEIKWEQPDDCLEIDARPICVADLTTKSHGPITIATGGTMIFEVEGSNNGGPHGQPIDFNYRPAGSSLFHAKSGTVGAGEVTLASSEVGFLGKVYVRIDGGSIFDRIKLKNTTDCSPSVTVEKDWTNVDQDWLDAYGVTVSFTADGGDTPPDDGQVIALGNDGGGATYAPGDTIALAPGESIELTEQVDGLPEGCTWLAGEEDDLSWTAPDLAELEAYLELWAGGEGIEGFHHVLTANNTVDCGEPDISLEKSADQTTFSFGEDDEDLTYDVTYTYVVTNTGDVELEALTLVDEILTEGVDQVVDLTDDLTDALNDAFGSTVLPVGASVEVTWDVTYDADEDPLQIDNVATVTGTDPFGEEVTDDDDESIQASVVQPTTQEQPEEPVTEKAERVSVSKVLESTETLARTGASVVTLLVAGLLALFTGAGTLVTRRKR